MTTSVDFHCLDDRPQEQKENNLIVLNLIQSILEQQISSYALENPLNLFDEDNHQIVRKVEFSKGLKNHQIVYGPDGTILAISNQFPPSLQDKIHRILMEFDFLLPPDSPKPNSAG